MVSLRFTYDSPGYKVNTAIVKALCRSVQEKVLSFVSLKALDSVNLLAVACHYNFSRDDKSTGSKNQLMASFQLPNPGQNTK